MYPGDQLLLLLTEMLERLASAYHPCILNIMFCLLQYIDLNQLSASVLNVDVLRTVSRHIHVRLPHVSLARTLSLCIDMWLARGGRNTQTGCHT
jgi:hypothetical protein